MNRTGNEPENHMDDLHRPKRLGDSSLLSPVIIERRESIGGDSHRQTASGVEGEPESLLMEYVRILSRRRKSIVWFALAGALLGFALTVTVLPVYRARTSLDIQNLNSDFMNMRDVAPTGENTASSADTYVQTQIKLLQSDTLLQRTANRMQQKGEALPIERGDLLSLLKHDIGLPSPAPLASEAVLHFAEQKVSVKPLGMTRLVEVTCDSWDPTFSAEFCNTLTSEFRDQDREVRWNEAQKTSEWLSRQLADVRTNLAESQKRLEASAGGDPLLLNQDNSSVAVEKLRQLQSELMQAQADRVAKQAQFEISNASAPDALPMVLDDGPLRDYQMKLVDLRRQLAGLMPPLTPEHPKVQHLMAEIKQLEGTMLGERKNAADRMRNEYSAARQRESLLSAAYATQEQKVSHEMGRASQVSMLRREVESGQQLYQTLYQKVKEAGFASAMQVSTIRVVDAAQAPQLPIVPRRGMSMVVGVLLGVLAGVALAFFRERTQKVLRAPGDVSRYLEMRELGVIPSAKHGLKEAYTPQRALSKSPVSLLPAGTKLLPGTVSQSQPLDMATWTNQTSLVAEAYRNATYSILLSSKSGERARQYVVTSPNVGEGKTTVTCNLALALAQAGKRVVVIDGDLRRPRLHKALNVVNGAGLRELLRGDLDPDLTPLAVFCRPTQAPNLSVISSGTGSGEPSGLLYSSRLKSLLERLSLDFDVVLVDSPPMLHLADARILAGISDGVILVFRARVTNRDTAGLARDLFLNDHIRVIGTILNDFDPSKEGRAAYYNSYYQYQDIAAGERTDA